MYELVERAAPSGARRAREHRLILWVAERNGQLQPHLRRHAQDGFRFGRIVDGGDARADAEIPRFELHEGRGLAEVEHIPGEGVAAVLWRNECDAECRAGQMPREVAALGELLQRLLLAHGDELPGLLVLRALRAPPGIENRAYGVVWQRRGGELAHGAHRGNCLGNCGHRLLLGCLSSSPVTGVVYRTANRAAASRSAWSEVRHSQGWRERGRIAPDTCLCDA